MDKKPRWEIDAERVRESGPDWFDLERAPWWLFVLTGTAFLYMGVSSLLDADSSWHAAWYIVGLTILIPPQFMTAYRLWRGIP